MMSNNYQRQLFLLCGDIVLIATAIYLAPVFRFQIVPDPLTVFGLSDVFAILIYILVLHIFDLYNFEGRISKTTLLIEFALAVMIINIINAANFYIFHLRSFGSWILLISSFLSIVFLVLWRIVFINITGLAKIPLKVLIIGAGATGKEMYDAMKAKTNYKVIGLTDDDEANHGLFVDGLPILGKSDNLLGLLKKHEITKVIVAINGQAKPSLFQDLVHAKLNGVTVFEMPTFYEKITGKIPVLHISNKWIGFSDICGIKKNIYYPKLKNILDKAIACIFLIITLPLLIIIALAIKLDSPGPVFYVQRRIGRYAQPFNIVKFRTMGVGLENQREFAGNINDPRITTVGKILRRFRIDEIPQLLNVIRGQMSIIGPRALMEVEVAEFMPQIPYFSLRHSILPGITGWAQINYRHGATLKDCLEKLQYDLYYLKNGSFILDIYIIFITVRVVLLGSGAR